ncbi:hypothetical protein FPQ18DRAFT_310287 [Pyronema domesticum]|uniref:Similar to Pre-mRNA-splicing factor slt11 acc. no. Q4W9V0 n=1 Tax=Pyronema omphalodes (strain CBS 100304) TaxID=1076935 RepID=U4LTY1_PYROM|nr:hypothetical protein FPQ18DRAFT_310287 [Pyronema domesticum]CCX33210.1 Similar to Pre-mRNA-splicing factor slt11; acc. no. Q4W9V0 [Pyronema omphalodes CBS 100304]
MPPKSDPNRAGRETTDFPSVCEPCLGPNPYIQMLKAPLDLECKICTRPFTVFRWSVDRTIRNKKTNICLTCARLKNCCQCCMLDLSFGLPIAIRDAALKLVAQGPQSDINKQYYAQNHEGELKDGGVPEEYEKTDGAARELLKRLAGSEPYQRRRDGGEGSQTGQKLLAGGTGPVRNARGGEKTRGVKGKGKVGRFTNNQLPAGPADITPPQDQSIMSLFLTGVEDDLAEHQIRTFFSAFGAIKSIVCVHRSHCAFVNFASRAGAEAAAESCQGKAVIAGCPLKIQWGKPRPLGNIDRSQGGNKSTGEVMVEQQEAEEPQQQQHERQERQQSFANIQIAKPPGEDDEVRYPSQAVN